jgi:hypothetical protein
VIIAAGGNVLGMLIAWTLPTRSACVNRAAA